MSGLGEPLVDAIHAAGMAPLFVEKYVDVNGSAKNFR